MKRIFYLIILSCLHVISSGAQIQLDFGKKSPLTKLQVAEVAIKNLYVDTVNENKLVEDAIRGMIGKLDPHSSYSTPKEVKAMSEPLQGNFEGIGVQFNIIEDTLIVIQTVANGPSEKVGIQPGDRIVSVGDSAIAGVKMARDDIMRRLRGKKGTKVKLGIIRRGIAGKLNFTVTRDKIPVHTVDACYMIQPQVGYIRLSSFGATTYEEFMAGVKKLRKNGAKTLLLDLQDNGGGYLQSAVQIAGEFLRKGDLIVYTNGRKVPKSTYRAPTQGSLLDMEVLVLVNEFSASASEILAGAIQDHDRGIIVGRRSFGKGLVQRPVDLSDGSMIRLTVAHYYTPSGRCIQKPYTKGALKEYEMDLENRLKNGELTNRDSIHFADSLRFYTLNRRRVVYGGGGIMPDHFVPLDTTQYTRFYRQMSAKSIVVNTSLRYIDKNRGQLKRKYPTFEAFKKNFSVPKEVMDEILAEAEKEKIKPKDDAELQQTVLVLQIQFKALIARDLWELSEYFTIVNEQSHIVQRALAILG